MRLACRVWYLLFCQQALALQRSDASRSGGCNSLFVALVLYVSGSKDAFHRSHRCSWLGDHVAIVVASDLVANETRRRLVSNSVKETVYLQVSLLAGLGVFDGDMCEQVLRKSSKISEVWRSLLLPHTPSPFASTGAVFQRTSTFGWLRRRLAITLLARN